MKKIAIAGAVALAVMAGGALAQEKLRYNHGEGVVFTPRFQPSSNPAEGHCILKVWVDDRATVSIRGDQIGVRTLSGSQARDEGSFCSGPLPTTAENFRIESSNRPQGGRVVDLSAPDRHNGYTGSVTINDPRNGGQIYVLDVWWSDPHHAQGRPVITRNMDETDSCQASVRGQIEARNHGRIDVDFHSRVRHEDMGSGHERVRGGGSLQGRDDTARFGYECVVEEWSKRVVTAKYEVQGRENRFR